MELFDLYPGCAFGASHSAGTKTQQTSECFLMKGCSMSYIDRLSDYIFHQHADRANYILEDTNESSGSRHKTAMSNQATNHIHNHTTSTL